MKNKLNLKAMLNIVGIIAFIAIIGISMTACEEGCTHSGQSATITVTGEEIASGNFVFLALDTKFWGAKLASSNTVILEMNCWECDEPDFKAGNYMVTLRIDESATKGSEKKFYKYISSKNISAGSSSLSTSDFTQDVE